MLHIDGDITQISSGHIVHQTNCIGVYGGLAGYIFSKWPEAREEYIDDCSRHRENLLGSCTFFNITNNLTLINLFGQFDTSYTSRATKYSAFGSALMHLKRKLDSEGNYNAKVYFPYLIGCGLGKGDWNIISTMIDEVFPLSTCVHYCKNA